MKAKAQGKKKKQPRAANLKPDTRQRLTNYFLSVIENPKADTKRRDEMAISLSKILASPQPRLATPKLPKPATVAGAKPRISTYVSKKREAEAGAMTAQKGSPWDGLINGSAHSRDDE